MTIDETMARLESLGDAARRAFNAKKGAGDNQFGVKNGDLRALAKEIKTNPELARALWATGNVDAQMLAILLLKPNALSAELRQPWMADADPWAARSGWSLTARRVEGQPDGLDLDGLLGRLEEEMASADPRVQWTMNNALVAIGIHHPTLRERSTAIGEALGVYRDYPVSKGCTSPFAPLWIAEMVRRQE